ncbi:MAG: Transcriptional regulator, MarR family [Candidatus Saccharibacteria bacterium]|nr:Transcriptional regulator, MarR family [Candidatus Saccharibacteria bacterium]
MNRDISQISTYESGVMQATANRILGRINADFLSNYDLTPSQWFVIGYCYDAGSTGIALSELMRLLDTSMPHITNTVNMLESKGILHKLTNPGDNRVKIAKLHPKYKKTADEIEKGLREELRTQLYSAGNITRQELSDYITVLHKLTQANK